MSEWIIETKILDPDGSSRITVGRASARMRSRSETYSIDVSGIDSDSQDSRKNSEDGRLLCNMSPTISSGSILTNQGNKTPEGNEILTGSFFHRSSNPSLHSSSNTRGRLFSELSISDLPSEGNSSCSYRFLDLPFSLDISFPCSYDEDLKLRAKTIVHLRQAAIKRVVIRFGYMQYFLFI